MTKQPLKIEWKPSYETGNSEIDHEHREIINRLNRFFAYAAESASGEETINKLGEVYAWISAHFALEETIMRTHGYDQFQDHKDDHERLLDDIRDIMDACQAGAFSGMDDALQRRLEDWFVGHFRKKDSRLHKMLRLGS